MEAGVRVTTLPRARAKWTALAWSPLWWAQGAVLLLLGYLVLFPSVVLMRESVRGAAGHFTLAWYLEVYSTAGNYQALVNSLIVGVGSAVLATLLGTLLAWIVVRTDTPCRGLLEVAALVPFICPPFIGALAWTLLGRPNTGLLNQWARTLFGIERLVNIYSLGGMVLVIALYTTPFVLLIVGGALRSMDATMEEASVMAGAGQTATTALITLPLVAPAILGGAFLALVLALEQFGVPAVLGLPARIPVLTTKIWTTISEYPPQYGQGAALCMVLLLLTAVGVLLQRRLLRRRFTTVSGKGPRPRLVRLGGVRWAALALGLLYLLAAMALPMGVLVLASLRSVWTQHLDWSQLTLGNYGYVLAEYPLSRLALRNSLILGAGGATLGIFLAAIVSFLNLRARLPGHLVLGQLAMLPLAFPGTVLAYGMLRAWIQPPLVLYGTMWILLAAYIGRYLPYGVQSTSATLAQIHPELEESSLMSGASWPATFRNITLPLLRSGILAGWILLFVSFLRELSASLLLYTPKQVVLSVALFDLWASGDIGYLSALSVLMIVIAVVALALLRWLGAGGPALDRGGV
ncbi:MAG TPA: iron ABC transporter permease [Candidatus Methylomirabilis sp.]|nr:iron ABC transporter permease [Candidatus Methylomirabilis sp.]